MGYESVKRRPQQNDWMNAEKENSSLFLQINEGVGCIGKWSYFFQVVNIELLDANISSMLAQDQSQLVIVWESVNCMHHWETIFPLCEVVRKVLVCVILKKIMKRMSFRNKFQRKPSALNTGRIEALCIAVDLWNLFRWLELCGLRSHRKLLCSNRKLIPDLPSKHRKQKITSGHVVSLLTFPSTRLA